MIRGHRSNDRLAGGWSRHQQGGSHYYPAGRVISLCGGWGYRGLRFDVATRVGDCAECKRRRAAEIVAGETGAER